ncbi:hypothetical protein F2Q70_00011594 [Brassica cretica]|uniref:Uncharacterized protein n=1 Tax=Brassica cretica TaxID=69181 RepID=A0A8S9MBD7_BRACR|nr:hypothetical protein F2Q70_00011594 [Brassica cretica]KAF3544808.1 hypothetical protein DY000_02006977 [Brassica cretica]
MPPKKKVSKNTKLPHPNPESVYDEAIPKTESMAHLVDPDEADAYWVARGEVEYRISKYGECADNPPEGYFTCYEAYLFRCRLWFPIPVIIIQNLNRFELSISQVALAGLQHLIGILVLSYERGMKLDIDCFEALLRPKLLPGSLMYCLVPHAASVEESCIPVFRSAWNQHVPNPLPLFPEDLVVLRDLLRGGSFHGTYFTTKRVRRALACHRSQAHPQGEPKDKETALDNIDFPEDELPLPGWNPNFVPGDGSGTRDVPLLE